MGTGKEKEGFRMLRRPVSFRLAEYTTHVGEQDVLAVTIAAC